MADEPVHVLVAEDNPGDVRLIRDGLDESSIELSSTVVTDGETALDYLYRRNGFESETTPDLVLLDLNLPKKTGRDVLERVDSEPSLRSIPLVVLSGSQTEDYILETYERGAAGYFVKPADPYKFISVVQTVVDSIRSPGTLPPGEFADIDRTT